MSMISELKAAWKNTGTAKESSRRRKDLPLAEALLKKLGYEKEIVERVSWLVGHHHTYAHVEGVDYQILLEADYLVNSYENQKIPEEIETFCRHVFRHTFRYPASESAEQTETEVIRIDEQKRQIKAGYER